VAQPAPVAAAARGRHRSGSRAEPSGGRSQREAQLVG
jgi:hypothetical protein